MIRKLVIYRTEAMRRTMASQYPLLWNFDPKHWRGEFDDGVGNFGHIDFAVVTDNDDIPGLPRKHTYDAIELIGFDIPKYLL